ncbi:MAG: DUF3347 domain-containing protein [Oligoflexus sp.]|nr:DUF3347 domain-containing protein [Pseudopedobacter sp.]
MKKVIFTLAIAAIVLSACNQTEKKDGVANATTEDVKTSKEEVIKSPVMAGYISIKDALAKDDSKAAANAALTLAKSIKGFDESSLTTEQKTAFLNIKLDALEHAEHIGDNTDKIEHQRDHFKMLSEDIYIMAKNVDASQTFYKITCPMYKNGAFWLSTTQDIKNPFYGNKMSTCGSVEETIN